MSDTKVSEAMAMARAHASKLMAKAQVRGGSEVALGCVLPCVRSYYHYYFLRGGWLGVGRLLKVICFGSGPSQNSWWSFLLVSI